MAPEEGLQKVRAELETAIGLRKCQQCGCMEGALKNLATMLPHTGLDEATALAEGTAPLLHRMSPVKYACLGCEHCYPAVAENAFAVAFPALADTAAGLGCDFRVRDAEWPPVVGEYLVLDAKAPVALTTLASVQLAAELAQARPPGLAIVGKTETENIGLDKIIKNVLANSALRYLIVAGADGRGHLAGQTLLALAQNGVDENGRVIGSAGKRPILRNVSPSEIEAFRERVQLVDMIGCEEVNELAAAVDHHSRQETNACGCSQCDDRRTLSISTAPTLVAAEPGGTVQMDRAGYFVVVPLAKKGIINVEHYAYDNSLLRVVEGTSARAIYRTLVDNGWVTELSHAAYLGKELARAELSLQHGFKYVQDGA